MEYNQDPRKQQGKPQAANQSNQFGKENIQGPKQAANPQQPGRDQQQGAGRKEQPGSPYGNKPSSNPKQQEKNPNLPPR